MTAVDTSVRALATTVRLMLGGRGVAAAAWHAHGWVARFDASASSFRAGSEPRVLDADTGTTTLRGSPLSAPRARAVAA